MLNSESNAITSEIVIEWAAGVYCHSIVCVILERFAEGPESQQMCFSCLDSGYDQSASACLSFSKLPNWMCCGSLSFWKCNTAVHPHQSLLLRRLCQLRLHISGPCQGSQQMPWWELLVDMEDVTYQSVDPVLHVILMQFGLPQETFWLLWRRNDRFGLNILDYRLDLIHGPSLNGHPFAR